MTVATLWVDSDVARRSRKLAELAELARTKGVRVVVHAHVHMEQCRQVREQAAKDGEVFAQERIESYLDQLGIEVETATIDRATAEAWADLLHRRFPRGEDWKRAKLSTVAARLPDDAKIRPNDVPFTTDWLVALEVERRGVHIAVEDKGEEWAELRRAGRALSYQDALAWLRSQADAAPGV